MFTEVVCVGVVIAVSKYLLDKINEYSQYKKALEETERALGTYASTYQLEEADEQLLERIQPVLKERFPEGIVQRVAELRTVEQRGAFFSEFTQAMASAMGVQVNDVIISEEMSPLVCGSYVYNIPDEQCPGQSTVVKQVYINAAVMMCDPEKTVDTVIHELSHAVQAQSVFEEDTWGFSSQRKALWQDNWQNYSQGNYSDKAYLSQPVELHSFTIASRAIEQYKQNL